MTERGKEKRRGKKSKEKQQRFDQRDKRDVIDGFVYIDTISKCRNKRWL